MVKKKPLRSAAAFCNISFQCYAIGCAADFIPIMHIILQIVLIIFSNSSFTKITTDFFNFQVVKQELLKFDYKIKILRIIKFIPCFKIDLKIFALGIERNV